MWGRVIAGVGLIAAVLGIYRFVIDPPGDESGLIAPPPPKERIILTPTGAPVADRGVEVVAPTCGPLIELDNSRAPNRSQLEISTAGDQAPPPEGRSEPSSDFEVEAGETILVSVLVLNPEFQERAQKVARNAQINVEIRRRPARTISIAASVTADALREKSDYTTSETLLVRGRSEPIFLTNFRSLVYQRNEAIRDDQYRFAGTSAVPNCSLAVRITPSTFSFTAPPPEADGSIAPGSQNAIRLSFRADVHADGELTVAEE
jgi:hypothetical protein